MSVGWTNIDSSGLNSDHYKVLCLKTNEVDSKDLADEWCFLGVVRTDATEPPELTDEA